MGGNSLYVEAAGMERGLDKGGTLRTTGIADYRTYLHAFYLTVTSLSLCMFVLCRQAPQYRSVDYLCCIQ